MIKKICPTCLKFFYVWNYERKLRKFCSVKCVRRSKKYKLLASINKLSEKNPMWKGKKAGLVAIHKWILVRKPKPKVCEGCKKSPPKDLANISQKYKRDVNDFEWLCRRCHMEKDGRLKKINLINHKRLLSKIRCSYCKKWFKPKSSDSTCCSLSCASKKGNKIRWKN